ncbi:MAG TPA: Rid family detoxifying hydrolase [Candidatus Limnocylindrales bacterium]|nr:Rid family detoxifying hydrolase [Candidatus Limnocylindrales bacterium]
MSKVIRAEGAPAAIGPYSQARMTGDTLYCSGQIGLDPQSGDLVAGGFEAQARRVLANLEAVLHEAGMTFAEVVKLTVYLTDLTNFPALNTIFGELLPEPHPARATVQVAALPRNALVEIDLIAVRER